MSNKKEKETAKRIPSDQPTALIAPSDYEHIYNEAKEEAEKNKLEKQAAETNAGACPVGSETPTAMIAPSDYEHIYRDPVVGKDNKGSTGVKFKEDAIKKVPSNAPTALIGPSDYEHIYRDPVVGNENKMDSTGARFKEGANKKVPSTAPTSPSTRKENKMASTRPKFTGTPTKKTTSKTPTSPSTRKENKGSTSAKSNKVEAKVVSRKDSIGSNCQTQPPRSAKPNRDSSQNVVEIKQSLKSQPGNVNGSASLSAKESTLSKPVSSARLPEQLPDSIAQVIKRFIESQSKSYTINK